METKDLFKSFYDSYQEAIDEIESNHTFPEYFYDVFLTGQSTVYQKSISETKTFDEQWIRTVESYFPSLNKIALNPKSVLRYDEEVVPIEKARKINSASIRHLSANTHNIKEITDEMIIPKKILTTHPEIEYGTYENRLVMTLIDKLFYFVRHRYEIIKNNVESFHKNHFNLESEFPINNTHVSLKLDIVLKSDLDNKSINDYNRKLLIRVENLNKLVTSLKMGKFMQMMTNQKKVFPPLIKSNVIMKNIDYKNAYMLWLFLDRYNTLAYDLDIREKDLTFDEAYLRDIYQSTLINFATIAYNQDHRKDLYGAIKGRKYKRKGLKVIKKRMDDLELNPEPIEVEDVTINQYYLDKFKTYFKKSLELHEGQSKTYETSLKRALRDTLEITNTLYETFFELDEEEDIFKRLIREEDPVVELKSAKEKALVAKMIREVKEVDYHNAVRLEKRLLTKISSLDQKLISAAKVNKLVTSKKVRSVESLKKEKQIANDRKKALDKKFLVTSQNEKLMKNLKNKVYDDIQKLSSELQQKQAKELKALKVDLKLKLQNEKLALKKKHDLEFKKIMDKRRADIKNIQVKEAKDIQKIRENKQKEIASLKLAEQKRHAQAVIKEQQRLETIIEKERLAAERKLKLETMMSEKRILKEKEKVEQVSMKHIHANTEPIDMSLSNMLVTDLRQMAKVLKINNFSKLKKAELIFEIQTIQEAYQSDEIQTNKS